MQSLFALLFDVFRSLLMSFRVAAVGSGLMVSRTFTSFNLRSIVLCIFLMFCYIIIQDFVSITPKFLLYLRVAVCLPSQPDERFPD